MPPSTIEPAPFPTTCQATDGATGVPIDVDDDGFYRPVVSDDQCLVQPAGPIQTGAGGTLPATGPNGIQTLITAAVVAILAGGGLLTSGTRGDA